MIVQVGRLMWWLAAADGEGVGLAVVGSGHRPATRGKAGVQTLQTFQTLLFSRSVFSLQGWLSASFEILSELFCFCVARNYSAGFPWLWLYSTASVLDVLHGRRSLSVWLVGREQRGWRMNISPAWLQFWLGNDVALQPGPGALPGAAAALRPPPPYLPLVPGNSPQ